MDRWTDGWMVGQLELCADPIKMLLISLKQIKSTQAPWIFGLFWFNFMSPKMSPLNYTYIYSKNKVHEHCLILFININIYTSTHLIIKS